MNKIRIQENDKNVHLDRTSSYFDFLASLSNISKYERDVDDDRIFNYYKGKHVGAIEQRRTRIELCLGAVEFERAAVQSFVSDGTKDPSQSMKLDRISVLSLPHSSVVN